MNSRQRTLAILDRRPVDRPPVDLWYTPEIYDKLLDHSGCPDEVAMWAKLRIDKIAWLSPIYNGPLPPIDPGTDHMTPWGCPMRRVQGGAAGHLEYMAPPLAEIEDPSELESWPCWPDPEAFDLAPLFARMEALDGRFATLGPCVSLFEIYAALRGLENALADLITLPELVDAALDRIESVQSRLLDRVYTEGLVRPDLVFISDRMGSQNSLLMSPDCWDRHLRHRLSRWTRTAHSHGVRVFYHSDGAIAPLIPRLLSVGVDVISPMQRGLPGMGLDQLAAQYGRKIIFHGGIDTQRVLQLGTPDDVREEVRLCLSFLGRGYLPCSCGNIQAGTPIDNILAMIATIHEPRPIRKIFTMEALSS